MSRLNSYAQNHIIISDDIRENLVSFQEPNNGPASISAVKRLPLIRIEESDDEKQQLHFCIICYDHIEFGAEAICMPCGHAYHPK